MEKITVDSSLRTVEWRDNKVVMIDQTKLPNKLEFVEFDDFNQVANAIMTMVVRGAPAIGVSGAFGLALAVLQSKATTKDELISDLENARKILKECIESTLEQSYKKIEVIAINDGSSDNSLKILEKYSSGIKIISKPNGGTASALNVGIENMKGEWFKWLSADDVLYPNAIEELILETKKLKNKKNILYSNYDIINSEGGIIKQFIEPNYNELSSFNFNVILLDRYIGNGTTSLIHKSVLDEYGMFDETVGFAEDYELWLRFCLIHGCRLHLVPKILAKYRVHETQITQSKIGESLDKAEKIRQAILEKLDPNEQQKYKIALKKIKSKKPLPVKIRHALRDTMFRVLPKSTTDNILKLYFQKIKKEN